MAELSRDYGKEHHDLSHRYYQEGNPDKYTPGQFIFLHDHIWLDKFIEEGPKGTTSKAITDHQAAIAAKHQDIASRSVQGDINGGTARLDEDIPE